MKRLFSMFALLATATLAFAQTATLQLDIEAQGAEDETVFVISLMILTGDIKSTFTVVTMFGPEASLTLTFQPTPCKAHQRLDCESCRG